MNPSIFILSPFLLLVCSGCEISKHYEDHDPTLHLKEEEYDQNLTTSYDSKRTSQIFYKSLEKPLYPKDMLQKVSLSFTNKVPIHDILIELGHQSGVNMVMSPNVTGEIMLQASNAPFIQIIKQICDIAKFYDHIEKGVLYIEKDRSLV